MKQTDTIFKNLIFCILVLLFSINTLSAQSLLWEVKPPKSKKTSYIFGTMHLKDERVLKLDAALRQRFDKSEAVALELVMDGPAMAKIMQLIMMPEDTSLKQLLDPARYDSVMTFLKNKMGPMTAMMAGIKPAFLTVMLMESGRKSTGDVPLDLYLQQLGKEKGKEIIGIETVDEQMAVFNNIPLSKQADMLMEFVTDYDRMMLMTDSLVNAYISQDLNKMKEFLSDTTLMPAENRRDFVENRNHLMADRMHKIFPGKSVFMAVGAGHLPGEEGVLNLLKQKGYTVTPVKFSFTEAEVQGK